jgi:hypothetical protein
MKRFLQSSALLATLGFAMSPLAAAGIEVIYSEIPTHPSSIIPGALDASGNPIEIRFKAIEGMNISPDGTRWIVLGRANADTTIDTFLLIGSGTTGNMLAQEAQPVHDGQPNEVYDFFDSIAKFNDFGEFAFGARARNGVSSVKEKVIRLTDKGGFQIVAHESAPLTGALDLPPNPSGDELLGNSLNSIHLLNDGRVFFVDAATTQLHTTRRPLVAYHDNGVNVTFLQSGVTIVGPSFWDSFTLEGFRITTDGEHYLAIGDDEGSTATAINNASLAQDGTWFARGNMVGGDDWAISNNVLIAQTGAPITNNPDETELWGDTFLGCVGNSVGDVIVVGNTNIGDPARDTVVVLNQSQVILREGDPVDLDGNGEFDDDVFIGRGVNTNPAFAPDNFHLTDDGMLYFVAPLRDSAGNDLGSIPAFGSGGQAFMRMQIKMGKALLGDMNCDGVISVSDIGPFVLAITDPAAYAAEFPKCDINNADVNQDGTISVSDIGPFVSLVTGG